MSVVYLTPLPRRQAFLRRLPDSLPPPVAFSPPKAPPISAPDVGMLTLTMPQSEPFGPSHWMKQKLKFYFLAVAVYSPRHKVVLKIQSLCYNLIVFFYYILWKKIRSVLSALLLKLSLFNNLKYISEILCEYGRRQSLFHLIVHRNA